MCFYEEFIFNKGELYGILGLPFKRAWLWGVLGDLRVIFIHAESAPSVARFRVVLSELRYGLVENCSEVNSHFGWRWVGRMNAPAQDIGGGGKLWGAMRRAESCGGGKLLSDTAN